MFFLSQSLGFGQALRRRLRTDYVRGISILLGVVFLLAITLMAGLVLRTRFLDREKRLNASSDIALENAYDVGTVLSGEIVSHAFVFTNTTSELLRIGDEKDIQKDCGCAAVEPEARELKPGASTKIAVKVDTRGKSGRFTYGGTIAWSPPNGEKIEAIFRLHGDISPVLECDPASLGFGQDEVNGRVAKEITESSIAKATFMPPRLSLLP